MSHRHAILSFGALLAIATFGCGTPARRLLSVASTPGVLEGQRTQVTITITNPYNVPIIPTALNLYVRPDPTGYFLVRTNIAETEFYEPLQATEVRHLATLDRIDADQVRDGNTWRRVPDSRFLHPRILLPGRTLSETYQFQAHASYNRLLYCDLFYLMFTGPTARGRLFARATPSAVPPDADRYTEVYKRIDESTLQDTDPDPRNYLLYRPRRPTDTPPSLVTRRVPIDVRPRAFSYADAARRARFGARTTTYFTAAGTWVFEYADGGTWFIGPVATTKLNGQYANLIADLELRQATELTLTAPRKADDKFLQLLQMLHHSDPKATGPTATATMPIDSVLPVLQQAESLGYAVEPPTWRQATP